MLCGPLLAFNFVFAAGLACAGIVITAAAIFCAGTASAAAAAAHVASGE